MLIIYCIFLIFLSTSVCLLILYVTFFNVWKFLGFAQFSQCFYKMLPDVSVRLFPVTVVHVDTGSVNHLKFVFVQIWLVACAIAQLSPKQSFTLSPYELASHISIKRCFFMDPTESLFTTSLTIIYNSCLFVGDSNLSLLPSSL